MITCKERQAQEQKKLNEEEAKKRARIIDQPELTPYAMPSFYDFRTC
jgi:hypothetical protein